MMKDNRIKYFAAADYNEGTDLDRLVKQIIHRTAANEELETWHYRNNKEMMNLEEFCSEKMISS